MVKREIGKRDEYHVRRYQRAIQNGIDPKVLSKYSRLIHSSKRSELLRHTCHVCAWVSGLPVEQATATATCRHDNYSAATEDKGLSPIGVLITMLQARHSGPFPQRLQSCVARLRYRISAVLSDPYHRDIHSLWEALQRALPRAKKKRTCPDMEDMLNATGLDILADRDKRWTRALRKYVVHQNEFRLQVDHNPSVERLLSEARTAFAEADAVTMCNLLLRGAALLQRPRLLNHFETGQHMCDATKERLRSALQTKVRRALLLCFRGLDFSYAGTCMRADVQIAASAIACTLDGIDLQRVQASKQWSDIKSFLDTFGAQQVDGNQPSVRGNDAVLCQRGIQSAIGMIDKNHLEPLAKRFLNRKMLTWNSEESEKLRQVVEFRLRGDADYTSLTLSDWRDIAKDMDIGKSGNSLKAHYRNMVDPRYMKMEATPQGLKHRGGVLKSMMKKAMAKLGGKATMPEIIEYCKSNEEIQQEFASQLIYHKTKVNGTTRELPLWEATAATNSSNMFRRTGERRQRHAVWTLK